MKLQAVPTVILHFRGFHLSSLSNWNEYFMHMASHVARKGATMAALCGSTIIVSCALKLMLTVLVNAVASCAITFATYTSLAALSSTISSFVSRNKVVQGSTCASCVVRKNRSKSLGRLPRLQSKPVLPSIAARNECKKGQVSSLTRPLPAVRRRILARLQQAPPIVNVVSGEIRQRADMPLYQAKIRVGKAYLETNRTTNNPFDVYMVRINCGTEENEKHMNPVIMWDVSATFDEFKRLESELRKEIKSKRRRDVNVPHLSSGSILFVQPELSQHVLNARRTRLQAFIDAIRTNQTLAETNAMRKFCQAL